MQTSRRLLTPANRVANRPQLTLHHTVALRLSKGGATPVLTIRYFTLNWLRLEVDVPSLGRLRLLRFASWFGVLSALCALTALSAADRIVQIGGSVRIGR